MLLNEMDGCKEVNGVQACSIQEGSASQARPLINYTTAEQGKTAEEQPAMSVQSLIPYVSLQHSS